MDKEKLLELLSAKFPQVRKDGLNQLASSLVLTTTDENAQQVIDGLKEEQVQQFVTDWRKQADKEITEATNTREKNLREKYDFVDKGNPNPPVPPQPSDDIQKMIREEIERATQTYREQLNAIETKNVTNERKEVLLKTIEGTPESFKSMIIDGFNNRSFASAEDFNAYIESTKQNVASITQELANAGLQAHVKPTLGNITKEGISAATDDYIKELAKGGSDQGKKL